MLDWVSVRVWIRDRVQGTPGSEPNSDPDSDLNLDLDPGLGSGSRFDLDPDSDSDLDSNPDSDMDPSYDPDSHLYLQQIDQDCDCGQRSADSNTELVCYLLLSADFLLSWQ